MTKTEVYKAVVEMQRKTGQGTMGIIRIMGLHAYKIGQHLDDLIEEGLVKRCHTGGSLGHEESNVAYVPTKGYNIWEDNDYSNSGLSCKPLHFIRRYLGINEDESMVKLGMAHINDTEYNEWLEKNKKELEVMKNLDDSYEDPGVTYTEDELKFIKSQNWFKDNLKSDDCISKLNEINSLSIRIVDLHKKALDITRNTEDIEKRKGDISELNFEISLNKKVIKHFNSHSKEQKAQDLI